MGLMEGVLTAVFGGGRNRLAETVEVFRENAEAGAARAAAYQGAALDQFGREFMIERRGWFDRFMDGLNRLPRPALALGTLFLFVTALVDPIWFAARMQGIALVPEPLWWLMGAIVSFYFGARHQAKGQEFQRSIAAAVALAPQVQANMAALAALQAGAGSAVPEEETALEAANPALDDWRELRRGA
ncbi:holin family protein [Vannielia litorea]|uniref:Holin of 3TMs, for gene-transfer release n=1 Tax=Vannielia litorea TaxID=1217970 RepID=A0A1N6EUS6_9RHOB|nr:holin family protein [Vannielia litorea]SIN86839.1 Holin of 3TMs, for gene-transfer release [Vannielia litorea]